MAHSSPQDPPTETGVGTAERPPQGAESRTPLLEVRDLAVEFDTERGVVHAVNGATFDVAAGETLAIVGESGSGKSVTLQAVMGALPSPPATVTRGEIRFRGEDLRKMPKSRLRALRGTSLSLITQDALTALNPSFTVGFQIAEMYRVHRGMGRRESKRRAVEMLDRVHIPDAGRRAAQYPHEFSGGMQQRAMIAMAIALDPDVLVADEPTTALDVTVQAQIMELLSELQASLGMALILITHDLALVSGVADRLAVMYAGRIIESGPVGDVFRRPAHPYTRGLMQSVPGNARHAEDLRPIPGRPPDLIAAPTACSYAPRCDRAVDRCRESVPPQFSVAAGRKSACFFASEEYEDA